MQPSHAELVRARLAFRVFAQAQSHLIAANDKSGLAYYPHDWRTGISSLPWADAFRDVQLRGHIIDSLILPKVLDEILAHRGNFKIGEIRIGEKRADQSFARIEVTAPTRLKRSTNLILRLRQHGAEVVEKRMPDSASARRRRFPADFYVTTNQQTFVRIDGKEIEVSPAIMDSAIVVDRTAGARGDEILRVRSDMEVVVGHQGIRVAPLQTVDFAHRHFRVHRENNVRSNNQKARSSVRWRANCTGPEEDGKILVVAGPAVVHTGAGEHLEKLIEWGYVNLLFAGNALAAHDIENALFGTSLGVILRKARSREAGHENHMRAINAIRERWRHSSGSEKTVCSRAASCSLRQKRGRFVLAGSIRDDGPLPEVITDAIEAQKAMRAKIEGVTIAMMMGTMLHSIAVGNLLPASVKTLCVDINPGVVTKLTDRGTFPGGRSGDRHRAVPARVDRLHRDA